MKMPRMGSWLLLTGCILVVVADSQDNVLRFLSQKELKQAAKNVKVQNKIVIGSNTERGQPMQKFRTQNAVCPDGLTECTGSSTCCPLLNGQYSCCDGVNAVCCRNGVHCCPEGFECDEELSQCSSAALGISFHWVDKKPVRSQPVPNIARNFTCADKKTVCEENDTCCNATIGYGCCPLMNAVCCSDKAHCCPNGTKCDVVKRHCYRGEENWEMPWVARRPIQSTAHSEANLVPVNDEEKIKGVTCNDGQMCPNGDTCCQLSDGSYGCCPFSDAVCCSDHVHCCPHGCTCDYVKQGCVGYWIDHKWSTIVAPVHKSIQTNKAALISAVVCPGGSVQCPDGSTCCQLASGEWGCCPTPNATCCSDHIHCCPYQYTCNVSAGTCNPPSGNLFVPWDLKKPALPRVSGSAVVCPGGRTLCADGQTCCEETPGIYGCCPYQEATCCSDHAHCCPHGYTCDLRAQTCVRKSESIPWLTKQAAIQKLPGDVICPDQTSCPDGQTCCETTSGSYGCCPTPNATCCSDHIHCCPAGYTCNLSSQTCEQSSGLPSSSVPLLKKLPAVSVLPRDVTCPDQTSSCPDGQTCCLTTSGSYGCCPIPNATCCDDRQHCCPQGYTCNLAAQTCDQGFSSPLLSLPLRTHVAAISRLPRDVTCPDQTSSCPDGQTCCLTTSGSYGCCPIPNATCCDDRQHCCPQGYTCNLAAQTCDQGSSSPLLSLPLRTHVAAISRVKSIICPDQTVCPDGQTCCELSSGQYGCCPQPNAVCCSDHLHCCPAGYTCDVSQGLCNQGQRSLSWYEKLPATPGRH